MPQTWQSEDGHERSCPYCNALYRVTITRLPCRDADSIDCKVCGKSISWNSTPSPPGWELVDPENDRPNKKQDGISHARVDDSISLSYQQDRKMKVAVALEGVTLDDPFTMDASRVPCVGECIYHPQNGIMRVKQVIHPDHPQKYAALVFAESEPTPESHEKLLVNVFGL